MDWKYVFTVVVDLVIIFAGIVAMLVLVGLLLFLG